MKKFRVVLSSLLVVACYSAILVIPVVNASTEYDISEATISADVTYLWWPTDNTSGFSLTNGGKQVMKMYFTTSGNKVNMGFKKVSSGSKYSWYNGKVSGTSKYKSKVLSGASGYYKVYVTNNNDSVSLTVTDSSVFPLGVFSKITALAFR